MRAKRITAEGIKEELRIDRKGLREMENGKREREKMRRMRL